MHNNKKLSRRNAIKMLGLGSSSLLFSSNANASTKLSMPASHKKVRIVIVGGGSGGMMSVARLRRSAPNADIIMVSPNKTHLYQSGQTFVAAGLYTQAENERATSELLEDKVKWLQERVVSFNPEKNSLKTDKSGEIKYDFLVVALGVEYDYKRIKGLTPDMLGKNGIASVYMNNTLEGASTGGVMTKEWFSEIHVAATDKAVKILLSEPNTPIKGVGTSLDILFLGNDILKGKGPLKKADVHKNASFIFTKADKELFPSKKFTNALDKEIKKHKNISIIYEHNLVAVDAENKIATYELDKKKVDIAYDFIHIVPPMQTPKVLRDSTLAAADGEFKGYLEVDENTLQHKKYKNVFGVGDVLGIALGKTGGSAQEQAVIIQDNIAAAIENKELPAEFNGYTVAPIKTKFGKILLAEFNTTKTLPTFWLNPYKSRWIWWELDLHVMRTAYFSLMIRGMM